MKRKKWAILGTLALLAGMLAGVLPAGAAPPPPDYRPEDVGPEIRDWEATQARVKGDFYGLNPEEVEAEETEAMEAAEGTPYYECIIDAKYWLYLDAYTGFYEFDVFYLVSETTGSELWVQAELSWPAGDPRATPLVTCEQAEYMLGEFDNNILPAETDFFGDPDYHDGSLGWLDTAVGLPDGYWNNAEGRQVVLVSNIRDDNYYDSTYPLYIAGFFSPSFEDYFDRNIMSIDAYDWEHRTGPNPPDDPPSNPARPYLYEGVFAHEYQHLLHSDYDPDEENWINEGLSDLAEFLVGYGHPDSHVEDTAEYPENSLVVWEDQGDLELLSDYGHAYFFQLYMLEQLGESYIQEEFLNTANGISGVDSTLAGFPGNMSFADYYHDWAAALLIDEDQKKGGRFGFENIEFNLDVGTAETPNPEAYDMPGAPPWGTDYIWIDGDPKELAKFTFNGVDYTTYPTAWSSDGDVLWGGSGNLIDNWAIFETTGGGTLSFDTDYVIEDYWDFGFVQVSTDGGYSWTSLANAYTTDVHDPNAHPKVVENLPGLTGSSGGWMNMSFDLSAYAGQDVLVAFRYITDWATTGAGWYIDNVDVDGELISDGSDASVFKDITEILPINNDFTVTFVGVKEKKKGNDYKVHTMKLNEMSEEGLFELDKVLKWSDSAVMLVTFDAPEGFTEYADYSYDFTFTNAGPKK